MVFEIYTYRINESPISPKTQVHVNVGIVFYNHRLYTFKYQDPPTIHVVLRTSYKSFLPPTCTYITYMYITYVIKVQLSGPLPNEGIQIAWFLDPGLDSFLLWPSSRAHT